MKRHSPLTVAVSAAVFGLSCGLAWLVDGGHTGAFGLRLLPLLCAVAFGVQWLAFVPAYLKQTEHYYDLTGSLTYATLIALGLYWAEPSPRAVLLGLLVLVWCGRLGSFLFRRVRRDGGDGRFDAIKPDFGRFLLAWTLQGLWVFMTLLAALIAISSNAAPALDGWALAGALIWLAGFAIEVVADAQKTAFRANPDNSGQFIRSGLWAWSRHPNYFGEILLWCGICVIAVPAFAGWQWLGLLSPLFVAGLICGVSGIPLLEQRADARWGGQAAYEAYKATTPVLFPRPPR